jgi:hypothetical protein
MSSDTARASDLDGTWKAWFLGPMGDRPKIEGDRIHVTTIGIVVLQRLPENALCRLSQGQGKMKLIMSWGYVGRHTSDSRLEMAGKRVGE